MGSEGEAPGERRESRGRELALASLCHVEGFAPAERRGALEQLLADPPRGDAAGEDHFASLADDPAVRRFAVELVELVLDAWARIDAAIAATSTRWRPERMDRVDDLVRRRI